MSRAPRLAHLTTVDMSLALLLREELRIEKSVGLDVLAISAPGPYVKDIASLGVVHVPIGFSRRWEPWRDLGLMRRLVRILRERRIDILHTHTPKAGVFGRIAGRLAGVPVIVNTCHGLWLREGDRLAKRMLVLGVEALAARFSDAELYQNEEDRQRLSWAVPTQRSRVVGNGIDLDRFRQDEEGRRRIRGLLDVAEDTVVVGGVGRVVWEKGIDEFAAVARRLQSQAKFVWVGPKDSATPDGIGARCAGVKFLGSRTDMADIYSAFDIFVLPSYREGFSRSAMEAAACGVPMVLSDIRGCREIGQHGQHLLLVPPRDAAALTQAVQSLIVDPALRVRLGAAARERAMESFDQRAVARASLEAYRRVAQRRALSWADHPALRYQP